MDEEELWTPADDESIRSALDTLRCETRALPLADVRFIKARGRSRRHRSVVVGAAAAAAAVAVGVVGFTAFLGNPAPDVTPSATGMTAPGTTAPSSPAPLPEPVPAGVVGGTGGGILVDPASKADVPTLDVYTDFQCPVCAQFDKVFGPALNEMAKTGGVKRVVHLMSFMDTNVANDSSKRATNAAACAADAGRFGEYYSAVFAGQPAEVGDGYPDTRLAAFARTAGITGPALTTWQQCTTSGEHNQYVADVEDASEGAGVTEAPTVMLNGKVIGSEALKNADALVARIKAAKG